MSENLLRSLLQGASNSAASNVSAPVDGIAWLLRKAGLDIQKPVGGSDWMAERGLTAEPQNRLAGLLGEGLGGVAPMLAAAKAPQIASGLNRMAENAATPSTLHRQAGVISFPDDMPRPEKVSAVREYAERFAASLKEKGLRGEVEHSGSLVGPSSYVKVSNPITGAGVFDNTPFRFSDHGKGPNQAQFVREVQGDFTRGLEMSQWDDLLNQMAKVTPEQRQAYLAYQEQAKAAIAAQNTPLAVAMRVGRPQTFKALQDATKDGVEFSRAFSNSGKYLGNPK